MSSSKSSLRILLEDLVIHDFDLMLEPSVEKTAEEKTAESAAKTAKGLYVEYGCAAKLAKELDIKVTDADGKAIKASTLANTEAKKYAKFRKISKYLPALDKSEKNGGDPAVNQFNVFLQAIEDVKSDPRSGLTTALENKNARIELVGQNKTAVKAQEDIRISWPLKSKNPKYLLFSAKAGGSQLTRATTTPGQMSMSVAEDTSLSMVKQLFAFIEKESKGDDDKKAALENVKAEYGLEPTEELYKANGDLNRDAEYSKELFPRMSQALSDVILAKVQSWSPQTAVEQMKVMFGKYYKGLDDDAMAAMADKPPPYYYGIKNLKSGSNLVKMSEAHIDFLSALSDVLKNGGDKLGYVAATAGEEKTMTLTHNDKAIISIGVDCGITSGNFGLAINLTIKGPEDLRTGITKFTGTKTEKKADAAFEVGKEDLKDVAQEAVGALAAAVERTMGVADDEYSTYEWGRKLKAFFVDKSTNSIKLLNQHRDNEWQQYLQYILMDTYGISPGAKEAGMIATKLKKKGYGTFNGSPSSGLGTYSLTNKSVSKSKRNLQGFTQALYDSVDELIKDGKISYQLTGHFAMSADKAQELGLLERWSRLAGLIK